MTGTGGKASPATVVRPFVESWAAHMAELDDARRAIRAHFWEQWQREVIAEVQQTHPAEPVHTLKDALAVLFRRPPAGPQE